MQEVVKNVKVSDKLFRFVGEICRQRQGDVSNTFEQLATVVREFAGLNTELLKQRDVLQDDVNEYFRQNKNPSAADVVKKLTEIGYIASQPAQEKVEVKNIAPEIFPMAGPQLVVPADKVNMVLNAANARWQSLYQSLYGSNIIDPAIKDEEARKQAVVEYTNRFLDSVIGFEEGYSWSDIRRFSFVPRTRGQKECVVVGHTNKNGPRILHFAKNDQARLFGLTLTKKPMLETFIIEHNGLKIEFILDEIGAILDVNIEAALTYIIDLEDASISAPENKYEGYRILKGICEKTLHCTVRGEYRRMLDDTEYLDAETLQMAYLKRTSFPLVRDVGPHMLADEEIITVDGKAIPEKILDCFITSFIGCRYHVAPKMHGEEEVQLNVKLWQRINELQGLASDANKVGIMNEEMRTNAQLADCIAAAKDVVFFTNTGFLDYTGSFIDLMMHQGAIAPYRTLPAQTYKTSYEVHNVNVSLERNVPQVGAGMWAAIRDMAGLLKSKEGQVKGLTDTGWSPSPTAAAIHAMAFHLFGNVRTMQQDYCKAIKPVVLADMFTFPKAQLDGLQEKEKLENLDFAVHGLLAYAEPWVRRGIGCSGVKELSGEPLMEDRATARIKAAFCRNWLLHKVVTDAQVEESLRRMAKLVDSQNADTEGYVPLYTGAMEKGDWNKAEEAVRAVYDVIFNPQNLHASYVEPYFYPANRRQQGK